MPAPFRAAIFDMDGLLLDSERPLRTAWLQAARELGAVLHEADYLDLIGRNEADSRERLTAWLAPACSYAQARERAAALLAQSLAGAGYAVKSGAVRLLEALQARRIPCAVASSTHREEVEWRLNQAGLAAYFDGFNGGDEVARGKPHPDLFLLAAERLSAHPGDCLVFEDSEHGAQGARAAGMSVVVVPDLKHPSDASRQECLAVLASLEEAHARLADWFDIHR